MRLVSWNINHRKKDPAINAILRILNKANPDVVALVEVARRLPSILEDGLSKLDLRFLLPFMPWRGWGLLIASRWTIEQLEGAVLAVPEEEKGYFRGKRPTEDGEPARLLSVRVNRPKVPFEVHVVHVPPGSQAGWRKIDTFRSLAGQLEKRSTIPRILCGDFNEPREERPDGTVVSWAWFNKYAKAGDPQIWDEAVKRIFEGLPKIGMHDAIRRVHREDVLYQSSYRPLRGKSRRYDHVFASQGLEPTSACYMKVRNLINISDHTPVMVDFLNIRSG